MNRGFLSIAIANKAAKTALQISETSDAHSQPQYKPIRIMFQLKDSPGKGKSLFVLAVGIQKGDHAITEAPYPHCRSCLGQAAASGARAAPRGETTAPDSSLTPSRPIKLTTATTSRGISGGRNSAKSHSKMQSRPYSAMPPAGQSGRER